MGEQYHLVQSLKAEQYTHLFALEWPNDKEKEGGRERDGEKGEGEETRERERSRGRETERRRKRWREGEGEGWAQAKVSAGRGGQRSRRGREREEEGEEKFENFLQGYQVFEKKRRGISKWSCGNNSFLMRKGMPKKQPSRLSKSLI